MRPNRPIHKIVALLGAVAFAASMGTASAATKATKKAAGKKTTVKTTVKTPSSTPATTAAPASSAPATTAAPGRTGVKVVEIQNGTEPTTWDAAKLRCSAGSEGNRCYPIYGALYYMDSKTKEFTPLLADSLTTNDGQTWTLKLHPNVKFHDGSPFTADAVKTHWERIKDPTTASPSRADLLQVDSLSVVDTTTLRIQLVQRNQQFLWNIQRSAGNYIPSQKAMAENPAQFVNKPVGAGPFVMKEYKAQERTVMTANPDWPFWPGGKPNIEELTIRSIIDENQRLNNLTTNQATLVFTQFAPLRARATKAGFTFTPMQQEGGNTIVFNNNRAPFDDARVRRALQMSIDLKVFKQVNCECDDPPVHNLFDDDSPFYDRNQDFPKFDLEAAQKLIDEYIRQVNGGRELEITLGHFSTTANTINATFFQTQWAKLRNVKVNLDPADPVQAQSRVTTGRYGVHLWGNLFTDPDELYPALLSTSSQVSNVVGFKNDAMDSALNIGRTSVTARERKAAYSNVARLLNFEVPLMWYDRVPASFLHPKSYTNITWYNDGILRVDQIRIGS